MFKYAIHSVLALAACNASPPQAAVATAAAPVAPRDELETIRALLAGPPVAFDTARYPDRAQRIRAYVAALLAEDATYAGLIPALYTVPKYPLYPRAIPFLLQHHTIAGASLWFGHYALEKTAAGAASAPPPCSAADAVEVVPWWAPATRVLVCPDAYKPAVRSFAAGRDCGTVYNLQLQEAGRSQQESICGCGPNLIYCAPDRALEQKLRDAVHAEYIDTIARVIKNHEPYQRIITANETVRSPLASFFYVKSQLLAGEPVDWTAVQGDAKQLRPRPWNLGAGVISTPLVRFFDDADRVVVAHVWQDFLCLPLTSSRVETDVLIHNTKSATLRDSLDHLAEVPGCRDCHARMEYGTRFLQFATGKDDGTTFRPERAPRASRIYGLEATEVLWHGAATSSNLGAILAEQPSFVDCQVDKALALFYGNAAIPDALTASLRSQFGTHRDFARLLGDVAVARFAERAPAAPARSWIAIADDACGSCHGGQPARMAIPPPTPHDALLAARRVANHIMPPKPNFLEDGDRRALALGLCGSAGLDPAACTKLLYPFDASPDLLPIKALIARIAAHRRGPASPEFDAIVGDLQMTYWGELGAATPDPPPEAGLNASAYLYLLASEACATAPDPRACTARLLEPSTLRR